MLVHPEYQKRAQLELDKVVGPSRLPTMEDIVHLPYIEAILKEVLRWKPVTPLALPHTTASSDEYRGYYIPKGAIVLGVSSVYLSKDALADHRAWCSRMRGKYRPLQQK